MKVKGLLLLLIAAVDFARKSQERNAPIIKVPKNYLVDAQGGMIEMFVQTDAVLDISFSQSVDWVDTYCNP